MNARRLALLALALASAGLVPASAAEPVLSAQGGVLVPTGGVPIVFGAFNACDPEHPFQTIGGFSLRIPPPARGGTYTLTGTGAAGGDFDIVWLRGPQGISCVGIGYDGTQGAVQRGTVPAQADWAYIVLFRGVAADFTFVVR